MNRTLLLSDKALAPSHRRAYSRRTLSLLLVFAFVTLFMWGLDALLVSGRAGSHHSVAQSNLAWLYSAFADVQMSMVSLLR